MENLSSSVSLSSGEGVCRSHEGVMVLFSLIVIVAFLVGQPVIAKTLWLTFTSKKAPDILNCNFALFNNLHQVISILHVIVLFSRPDVHDKFLTFSLVYGQIGGSMNFFCICIERYVAVVHPMSYPLLTKYRFREICVVLIWSFSVTTALICILYDVSSVESETSQLLPTCVLVVMIGMMLRCSVKIARTLKRSGPGTDKQSSKHPAKRKAFIIVCASSNIAFCCYAPIIFLQRFTIVTKTVPPCTVKVLCALFLSLESVVHPLFYLSTQERLCACFQVKKG